jgi:hypothetical protein
VQTVGAEDNEKLRSTNKGYDVLTKPQAWQRRGDKGW